MTSYARARAHGPVDRDRTCLLQISLEPQLHTSEFEIVRALSREFMSGLRRGGISLVTAASEQIQLLLLAPNTKGLNCWLTGGRADGRADGRDQGSRPLKSFSRLEELCGKLAPSAFYSTPRSPFPYRRHCFPLIFNSLFPRDPIDRGALIK